MSRASGKPRAVADANVVVCGSISPGGVPFHVLQAWRRGAFVLLLSTDQATERRDGLSRPWITARVRVLGREATAILGAIEAGAAPVTPLAQHPLPVRDPKDEPILAAALGGNADFLVTGDKDLLVSAGDPRRGALRTVTAAEFLAVLGEQEAS